MPAVRCRTRLSLLSLCPVERAAGQARRPSAVGLIHKTPTAHTHTHSTVFIVDEGHVFSGLG